MKVSDFMTNNVITGKEDETVEAAAKKMFEGKFSVLPIVDVSDHLVGILTESDFVATEEKVPHALASIKSIFGQVYFFSEVEEIYQKAKKMSVKDVMSKNPTTVSPDTTLTEVVGLMTNKKLKRLPVVDGKKLVGIVTRKDLIKAFAQV